MHHVRGGLFTSYAADLANPPWLYIVFRGLAGRGHRSLGGNPLSRWLGSTPERAATSIFIAGVVTEVSQIFWPNGFFGGTFDPLDLVAFATGLLVCYILDRRGGGGSERA
jgi:hypothetical protein